MEWENNPYPRKVESKFFALSSGPMSPVRNGLDRRGVFRGGHACDLLELPGKIMDGCITKKVGNLGEIVVVLPDELLGQFYLQVRKIVNDATLIIIPE